MCLLVTRLATCFHDILFCVHGAWVLIAVVRAHDGKHEGRKRLVVVQSKSFVIFIKVVNVKFVGTVLERSRGFSSWIRFRERSFVALLVVWRISA